MGEFRALVDVAERDRALCDTLKRVLKLSKVGCAAFQEAIRDAPPVTAAENSTRQPLITHWAHTTSMATSQPALRRRWTRHIP